MKMNQEFQGTAFLVSTFIFGYPRLIHVVATQQLAVLQIMYKRDMIVNQQLQWE